ncbi:AMP-binding protein [Kutzneria sp. CA-103260]|uniref:AMP-binding protein n=1 Tax=Kutzneria sp. CA-103260 TaxID=2802641 RepID=UPI001BABA9C8|nr:AMP-binding protein [Kutzneria sp. CA-103260]QUQ64644.1 non-ribosomal peptide synthetase [Kutzneria sp. CA-103260]
MSEWLTPAAEVLGLAADELAGRFAASSFVALGGSSLGAIELLALGQQRLSLTVDAARLLGPEPLGRVLRDAVPYQATEVAPDTRPDRELLPGQRPMLATHLAGVDRPYHLMFTLECDAPLDPIRAERALAELVAGNSSLRTMFVADGANQARRVLPPTERPRIIHQHLSTADPVRALHELYGRESTDLLRPFEAPPVVFVLSGQLLTMLVHHVLVDGWSIGVLWRQFVELYHGRAVSFTQQPEQIAARPPAELDAAVAHATAHIAGAPTVVDLPSDGQRAPQFTGVGGRFIFDLDPAAARAAEALAARCQVTVTTVVLAAWALVVARRTGQDDLLVGMPASGRFGADMMDIVGLCTRVVPVRCRISDEASIEEHVRAVADGVAAAVADAAVPYEQLVAALGLDVDPARNPVTQIGFAAHHELIPDAVGGWRLHEGHCGGAVFDALLYLQRWSACPRLALEYATCALTASEAGELADSLTAALLEFGADPSTELSSARTISAAQRERITRLGTGMDVDPEGDLWQSFERQALRAPDAPAISDTHAGLSLTYGQLRLLALANAARLAAAGVTAGDRVLLELPRSADEAVAILAIFRLGAAYVAMDTQATAEWRDHVLATSRPTAQIGPGDVDMTVPATEPDLADAPRHLAYVAYTSGSSGLPKGILATHRAVLRLAADTNIFAPTSPMRVSRLAPLAFDASTLELLVTLARGDAVEVYPPGDPDPATLVEFLPRTGVTHVWMTTGLFHIIAEHRPDAFRGVRQVLTGGSVTSPRLVQRVLEHCAGLRVTHAYGPTENTVFTTVHHFDGPHQVGHHLPIGTAIAGTGLAVLDQRGGLVPPGGVGELYNTGVGLADGYLGDPERTAAAFVEDNVLGERAYRTGDLARWDGDGRLRFHGRVDRQVKIAGHRVELVDVERRIAGQPGVLHALVFLSDDDRLCVAVRTDGVDLAAIRAGAEAQLPAYARPQRWIETADFPVTRNGKIDTKALTAVESVSVAAVPDSTPDMEEIVTQTWITVLGTDDFDSDEPFFEVGGDSLRLAQVRNLLRERLSGRDVSMVDLYRYPTVQALARHLAGASQ